MNPTYRIERRLRSNGWRWCLIDVAGNYVGSTATYLSAFRICTELNKQMTPERLAMFRESIRGESYRPHLKDVLRARRYA